MKDVIIVTCTIENHYTYTFERNQYKYVAMFFQFLYILSLLLTDCLEKSTDLCFDEIG